MSPDPLDVQTLTLFVEAYGDPRRLVDLLEAAQSLLAECTERLELEDSIATDAEDLLHEIESWSESVQDIL